MLSALKGRNEAHANGGAGVTKCSVVTQLGQSYWMGRTATSAHLPGLLETRRQQTERGTEKTSASLGGREETATVRAHTWEAVQHPLLQPRWNLPAGSGWGHGRRRSFPVKAYFARGS